MGKSFMRFLQRNKKQVIRKGDMCLVRIKGTLNLPQIVMENNEVMYIGEFKKDTETIAICSSTYVSELLFIQKELLTRCKVQPTWIEKIALTQLDTMVAIKEISFALKSTINYQANTEGQEEPVSISREEDTKFN